MLNPFFDTNKTAIILSQTSQASARSYKKSFKATETKKENLFQLLDREYNKIREKKVAKAFELVA